MPFVALECSEGLEEQLDFGDMQGDAETLGEVCDVKQTDADLAVSARWERCLRVQRILDSNQHDLLVDRHGLEACQQLLGSLEDDALSTHVAQPRAPALVAAMHLLHGALMPLHPPPLDLVAQLSVCPCVSPVHKPSAALRLLGEQELAVGCHRPLLQLVLEQNGRDLALGQDLVDALEGGA
eukprot:CAMPEP_0196742218 /NCGR_PEP_ID=MMETSP1091-20130531/45355_1 /TAXON_ID=302021 /ORGANISM="Rhodomonas sp., Strain CCMP768" /LENGTH=181 /DNA_ID=CAMNT_0042088197 /DNA_START=105 /DNA_END=650 /DNA_ORIENTATION=+